MQQLTSYGAALWHDYVLDVLLTYYSSRQNADSVVLDACGVIGRRLNGRLKAEITTRNCLRDGQIYRWMDAADGRMFPGVDRQLFNGFTINYALLTAPSPSRLTTKLGLLVAVGRTTARRFFLLFWSTVSQIIFRVAAPACEIKVWQNKDKENRMKDKPKTCTRDSVANNWAGIMNLGNCCRFCRSFVNVFISRRHYLYEQQIARMTWKIDSKDLLLAELEPDMSASDKTVRFTHFRVYNN